MSNGSTAVAASPNRSDRPVDSAVADLNADRRLDVVEALYGGGLSVRFAREDGGYAEPVLVGATVIRANRVVAADLSSDGNADLLAYSKDGSKLWLVPSDGAGGFAAIREVTVAEGVRDLALGDFDRNGGLDVAVAAATTAQLVVLWNGVDRMSFTTSAVSLPSQPLSITGLAFDADNQLDLVVGLAGGVVAPLKNDGGSFVQLEQKRVEFAPELMATGDVDRDGWPDLVVASTVGKLASFARVAGGIGDPVVSNVDAPLSKIDVANVDGDMHADVVGYGSSIVMAFEGLGGARFDNPRQATDDFDVQSLAIVKNSGGVRSELAISRPSGVEMKSVTQPFEKLRQQATVTTTADEYFACVDHDNDPMTPQVVELRPAPAGSLRAALEAAGPNTTITFALQQVDPVFTDPQTGDIANYGGFSPVSLTWHIAIARALEVDQPGIQILGETQSDTNPFGPEVAIQPANLDGIFDAIVPDNTTEFGIWNAFEIFNGGSATISHLIIAGTNFGNFLPFTFFECPPNPDDEGSAVVTIGSLFFNAVSIEASAPGNVVRGNFIGTDQKGFGVVPGTPVSSQSGAVFMASSGNRIGGDAAADQNIIVSGNEAVKVFQSSNNTIIGNIIGTDGTVGGRPGGTTPLRGVFIQSGANNTIQNNAISGSGEIAVLINTGASGTTVVNNRIGVDRLGVAIRGNANGGVVVNASTGTTIGPANIIAGTSGDDLPNRGGIQLSSSGSDVLTSGTRIFDNEIRDNSTNGIVVDLATNDVSSNNVIGPNNSIKNNSLFGVAVATGTGVVITQSEFGANGRIAINLVSTGDEENGITPNDAGDADSGPNGLLNFPVFTGSTLVNNGTQVQVTGTAPTGSTVEIFRSDATDPNGEGVEYLTTTPAPNGTFAVTLPITLPVVDTFILTATATTGQGTSEFGPNFILNQRVSVTPTSLAFGTVAVGTSVSQTVTICNNGVSDLEVSGAAVSPAGGPFSVSPIPPEGAVLAPGECTTVTVTYSPTSESPVSGSLVITTNDQGMPVVTIPLAGNAVLGTIQLNVGTLTIPTTKVGRANAGTIRVSNPTAVAVTVSRVEFKRRESRKVNFADQTDPFFIASPSSFTVPANGSVDVQIVFAPQEPLRTPDLNPPFDLPSPAYQTPRTVKSEVTFVVSDTLGITASALLKGKVDPIPMLDLKDAEIAGDTMTLKINAFDPDNNITNAEVVLYNEALTVVARVDATPGLNKALSKFAKGMKVPITLTYTGLAGFTPAVRFVDLTLVDARGNRSQTVRATIVYPNGKRTGNPTLVIPGGTFRGGEPGITLAPVVLAPR